MPPNRRRVSNWRRLESSKFKSKWKRSNLTSFRNTTLSLMACSQWCKRQCFPIASCQNFKALLTEWNMRNLPSVTISTPKDWKRQKSIKPCNNCLYMIRWSRSSNDARLYAQPSQREPSNRMSSKTQATSSLKSGKLFQQKKLSTGQRVESFNRCRVRIIWLVEI